MPHGDEAGDESGNQERMNQPDRLTFGEEVLRTTFVLLEGVLETRGEKIFGDTSLVLGRRRQLGNRIGTCRRQCFPST